MIKLLTIIPGLSMGGAEHMSYELIKNLDPFLFRNSVLCYGKKKNTPLEKKMESICDVIYGNVRGHISFLDYLKIFRIINSIEPDIVHAHMGGVTFAIPWIWLKKKPLIITIHTKPEKAFSKKNKWLIRQSLKKKIIRIVAVSAENQKYVQKYFSVDDSICKYINNGIDISRFTRVKHNDFTFINVARQDENKNQKVILDCFEKIHAECPHTKLFLIGDGPLHNNLCQHVKLKKLDKTVCIPGITDTPEKYYALSDVFVLASHREAMPLSVLEAMAAELPIITTDVGGLRDVVQENGIIVEDNDPDALFQAMRHIASCSENEIKRMKNASKRIVLNYSSEEMARQYSNLYISALEKDVV